MASIKINSKRHESKADKIKRHNALNVATKGDNSRLKPSKKHSKFGKMLFKAIKDNNPQLQNSDNYLLNLLISEYEIYIKAIDSLNSSGLVTKKGRKSPYWSISKGAIDEIAKLSSKLKLTPEDRINSAFHEQDNSDDDPIKKALTGDDN